MSISINQKYKYKHPHSESTEKKEKEKIEISRLSFLCQQQNREAAVCCLIFFQGKWMICSFPTSKVGFLRKVISDFLSLADFELATLERCTMYIVCNSRQKKFWRKDWCNALQCWFSWSRNVQKQYSTSRISPTRVLVFRRWMDDKCKHPNPQHDLWHPGNWTTQEIGRLNIGFERL